MNYHAAINCKDIIKVLNYSHNQDQVMRNIFSAIVSKSNINTNGLHYLYQTTLTNGLNQTTKLIYQSRTNSN